MPLYEVRIASTAKKELQKLETRIQSRIMERIDQLASEPRPAGVTKLKGSDALYRIRVGDYRIVYEIRDREVIVIVIRIGHRREVYH